MKIKNLQITSSSIDTKLEMHDPICIIRDSHSDLILDLIRELIGDHNAKNDPDRVDDGHFIIHSDIEIENKNYTVCYIRNADFMGDNRIAANFTPNSLEYSKDDTIEFIDKCKLRNKDSSNILDNTIINVVTDDDRPIFVYGLREADDAVILASLDTLAQSGRQIFISITANETHIDQAQREAFASDIKDMLQEFIDDAEDYGDYNVKDIITNAINGVFGKLNLPDLGTIVDDIYTVVLCPVCNHKTLDNYSICCNCGWEYDGSSENCFSAANGATLNAYREEYRKVKQELGGKDDV